jgi:hypothetical protein
MSNNNKISKAFGSRYKTKYTKEYICEVDKIISGHLSSFFFYKYFSRMPSKAFERKFVIIVFIYIIVKGSIEEPFLIIKF